MPSTRLILLIATVVLVGTVAPALAVSPLSESTGVRTATETPTEPANDTAVNVTLGAQLSTVLAATEVTTRGEIETARFELEFERGDEAERADALADRAEALADRAEDFRGDYREATEAREAGELTAEEYARRLAELNARAEQLLAEVDALSAHARNVSGLELEAAGFNRTALRAAVDDLDPLAGVGPSALLQRFLGESTGEVELRTGDGLRVEVEGEAGERSLEVTRPRDDNDSLTVPQDSALQSARGTLPHGNWSLTKASVHPDSGYYKFEFDLQSANRTGEAEVRVDGSSAEVFRLEVEIETPEDDREEDEDREDDADEEDDEHELALLLIDGTPSPNSTITVRALADGEPAANVTVAVNGRRIAKTDAHGEATVRLPNAAEVEVTAGDEGKLEFEFDEVAIEEREVFPQLDANATLQDEVVTVRVTFNGSPVEGATVYANDDRVGETGADGTVSFDFDPNANDELELEVVKGEFEAEFEYDIRDGELVLTESAHEGDGDKIEDEEEDGDEETEGDGDDEDDSSGSGSGDDEETDTPEPTETEDDDSSG